MGGPGQPAPRQPAGGRRGWTIYWVLSGLAVVLLAGGVGAAAGTLRTFSVPSDSMDSTVRPGDIVFVSTTTPARRGEVVVEDQRPGDGAHVRRVIGLPGDQVGCCNAAGRVTVNGRALHESYLPRGVAPSLVRFRATVPRGKLWLMGDNRAIAYDSRYTGPVAARVIGPVFLILRAGRPVWLSTPVTFSAGGLAPAGQPVPPGLIAAAATAAGLALLAALLVTGAVILLRRSRRQHTARSAGP